MKIFRLIPAGLIYLSLSLSATAANPFLDAPNDQPVSIPFRGTEWSDDRTGGRDISLTARAVVTRVAKSSWGSIFKIEFRDLKSKAKQKREISPEYFIVTDERIVLLNEEDNEAAAKKLAVADKAPEFAEGDVYGLTNGKLTHEDMPWESTVEVKGDRCVYEATHNSGHFKTVVWQKGVGLVEYASGYGAHADGYRLKRDKN